MIGTSAVIGTVWLLFSLFVSTTSKVPIADFWSTMTTYWSHAAFLANWIVYILVSGVELVAWIMALNGSPNFLAFWGGLVGYWGSIVLYAAPWIFAFINIAVTENWTTSDSTTMFILIPSMILNIAIGLIHFLFAERMVNWAAELAANAARQC